jgi:hypothetical protein
MLFLLIKFKRKKGKRRKKGSIRNYLYELDAGMLMLSIGINGI